MKQIIAIGGGGFTGEKSSLKIEKYILAQVKKDKPKICFLPQASNESVPYILKFYETFIKLGAEPSWVSLFNRVAAGWEEHLMNQDIIYVGGGNTKSMLALWRAWGLDKVLQKAYNKGIVLSGVSAGAICWFEQGITDSVWPLGVVDALGFLKGSFCPHFDSEIERQDFYRHKVKANEVIPGIALEDHVAVHFIDGKLAHTIKAVANKNALAIKSGKEDVMVAELLA